MSTNNPTVPSVGVKCGACDSSNHSDAKFCKGCGQPLYEQCSGCPHNVLLTQKFCDHCGTDLEAARNERRELHKQWMSEAVESAREYNFDRALRYLGRVLENEDYRFADDVINAKQAIEKIKTMRSQTEAKIDDTLKRAKQAYDAGNQPLTAQMLATIPEQMMTPDVKRLLTKVQSFSDQLTELDKALKSAVGEKDWPLVGGLVNQLLDLVPDDAGYQKAATQVGGKLQSDARALLSKGRYSAAVTMLESVPEFAQDEEFKEFRDHVDDLHWYSSQFEVEPFVTPMLGRLAVRFAKEVPEDGKAQQLVKQLAQQLKQGERPARTHFPAWHASTESWFGGQVQILTAPQSIHIGDHPVVKTAPGRFHVAVGLAIQGLGHGRIDDQFAPKKGLLGGLSRRKKKVWGIDLGNAALKAICLEEVDGTLVVTDAFFKEYEAPLCRAGMQAEHLNLLTPAVKAFLDAKEESLEDARLWVNVHASKLISRFVRLPPVKDKQAAALLKQEADQKIPIPIDDLSIVRWMADLNEESSHGRPAIVTATRRHVIDDRLEQLRMLGLEIDGLQADTLALVNFLALEFDDVLRGDESEKAKDGEKHQQTDEKKTPSVMLMDCGASTTNLIVVSSEAHWVWTMESGGEDVTGLIARPTKSTLAEAEKLKRNPADLPHPAKQYRLVEQRQDEIRARIETSFLEAMRQNERFQVEHSFCCGGACLSHGWVRRLASLQA